MRGLPYRGADTFAGPRHGDLAFPRRAFFAATKDYLPVARIARAHAFGNCMCLYRPSREEVHFETRPGIDGDVLLAVQAGDRTAVPDSGFLELVFDAPAPADLDVGSVLPLRTDPDFAALVRPWIDGDAVRIPFWNSDGDGAPAFRLRSREPFRVRSARLLR